MTQSAGKWSDLLARLGSAGVMIAVGFGAIIAGGAVFAALVAIICGLMVWELVRMFEGVAPASAWGPLFSCWQRACSLILPRPWGEDAPGQHFRGDRLHRAKYH
jgi:phosphatidate cytidylyltransferase